MTEPFYERYGGAGYQKVTSLWFGPRHKALVSKIKNQKTPSILDVSCGTGDMLSMIKESIPESSLAGIDKAHSMIMYAKQNHPDVHFTVGIAESLPYKDQSFDVITSCIALHHYTNPKKFIEEAFRVLKPEGQIIIEDICPRKRWLRKTLDLLAAHVVRDGHIGFKTTAELYALLESSGFTDIHQTKVKNITLTPIVITQGIKKALTPNTE